MGCTKKRYRHSIPSLMLPICILGRNAAVHLGSQMHRFMIVAPGAGIKRARSGSHERALVSIDDGESIKKVENSKANLTYVTFLLCLYILFPFLLQPFEVRTCHLHLWTCHVHL